MKGIYLTGVTAVAAFALPALVAVLSYLLGCINGAIATSHISTMTTCAAMAAATRG